MVRVFLLAFVKFSMAFRLIERLKVWFFEIRKPLAQEWRLHTLVGGERLSCGAVREWTESA